MNREKNYIVVRREPQISRIHTDKRKSSQKARRAQKLHNLAKKLPTISQKLAQTQAKNSPNQKLT